MANAKVSNAGAKAKGGPKGFNGKSSTGKMLSTEFKSVTTDPKNGKTVEQAMKITHR